MTLKNLGRLTTVLVCFATAAYAGHIGGDSSYGETSGLLPEPCTSTTTTSFSPFTFSCDTDGATITAEAFTASVPALNGDTLEIFDFAVTGVSSGYTLTLTATGAPINSANDLGLFTCDTGVSDLPQCSNDLPPGVTSTSDYGILSGGVASFAVSSATSADKFVFFVALDEGADPSALPAANVTASLSPTTTTTATPEPRMLSLLGLGFLAIMAFRRKAPLAAR
jgi:hypothetical protein